MKTAIEHGVGIEIVFLDSSLLLPLFTLFFTLLSFFFTLLLFFFTLLSFSPSSLYLSD